MNEETSDIAPVVLNEDAIICTDCGSLTVRVGTCYLCYNCGTSSGCS